MIRTRYERRRRRTLGAHLALAGAALCGHAGSAAAQDLFIRNARVIDVEAREVREGNLLILDGVVAGEPLEEITNTQGIWAVIHHGARVDREALLGG